MILKRILKSGKNQFIRMTDRSRFSFTNTPSNCVTDFKRFNKVDITLAICDMNVVASHRCISHTMAGENSIPYLKFTSILNLALDVKVLVVSCTHLVKKIRYGAQLNCSFFLVSPEEIIQVLF
jgi:hypothetical protein